MSGLIIKAVYAVLTGIFRMIIRSKAVASRYCHGISCYAEDTAHVSVSENCTAVIRISDASAFGKSDDTADVSAVAFNIAGISAFYDRNFISVSYDASCGSF